MLVVKNSRGKERLVFVHLHKCAGTFMVKLLFTMYPNSYGPYSNFRTPANSKIPAINMKGMRHIPHYELNKIRFRSLRYLRGLPAFGTIRNPWDYYVSLYHFSKEKADVPDMSGSIYNRLNRPETFDIYMKKLFVDTKIKNSTSKTGHAELFQRMDRLNIGVLSARYLNLFFKENIFNRNMKHIEKNYDTLLSINHIIKTENLYPELYNLLRGKDLGHPALRELKIFEKIASNDKIKRNKSKHNHYRKYYTDELIALVAEKERLIINKHNYIF